ncbi:MAG: hypothetical protein ACO2OS_06560 [Thermosphaera aggregans]
MSIRVLRVEDAVGLKLYHDYTCIELGFKGLLKGVVKWSRLVT